MLLKAPDEHQRLGLTGLPAVCLGNRRDPPRMQPELVDLVRQRIFGLAPWYADANDAGRLSADPMQRMLLRRDPVAGRELASQPTLSRFENGTSRAGLFRMGLATAEAVLDRARKRRGRKEIRPVTVDVDPMEDPKHGGQQLTFFDRHYDLPVLPASPSFRHLRRRARAAPGRGCAAAGQHATRAGNRGAAPASGRAGAGALPRGDDPRAARRRFHRRHDA